MPNRRSCEDWQIAFEPYANNSYAALALAFHLARLKELLDGKLSDIPEAIAALDRAIDALFEHSEFRNVGHKLFRDAVHGALTTEHENPSSQTQDKDIDQA
jgi:hypothetical protein